MGGGEQPPLHKPAESSLLETWLPILALLALSVAYLYQPPEAAANLSTVPDSVEYATSAHRLATLGRYDIEINHVGYPPRYSPGFPVLLLAPVYRLAPGDLGNGVYAVLLAAIVAVLTAYAIGKRLAGPWGGCLAGLGLLLAPTFREFSRDIMSDVPTLALGLLAFGVFLRAADRPKLRDYALAGLLVGISYSMRAASVFVWLPFAALALRRRAAWPANLAALTLPVLAAYGIVGIYNLHAFGQWSRTGYQYWCAVPYDYFGLTFSAAYLLPNLRMLATVRVGVLLAAGVVGAVLLRSRDGAALRRTAAFPALSAAPMSAFHLLYFAAGVRFHLLALAGLAVVAGVGIGSRVPRRLRCWAWAPPLLALPLALAAPASEGPEHYRRSVAEAIAQNTPRDAVIVTAIDAVFLDPYLVQHSGRLIVPIDRDVEYASKVIVRRRTASPNPPPVSAVDHCAEGLLRAGAIRPFPYTADEAPERIAAFIREGRPVYVDHSYAKPTGFWQAASPGFAEEPVEGLPWLRRLRLVSP